MLRAQGLIAKKAGNGGDVGRNHTGAEQGREGNSDVEGKGSEPRLAAVLAETATALGEAVAKATAAGSEVLRDACLCAGATLVELQNWIKTAAPLDWQAVEAQLARADADLANALWQTTGDVERAARLQSARADLQAYATRMDRDAFDETVRRQVIHRLRDERQIPRLGLFYLSI